MGADAHSHYDTRSTDALETVLSMCMVLFSYNAGFQMGCILAFVAIVQVVAGKPRLQLLPLYCGACMPLAGLVVDDLQEHASSLQVASGVLLLLSVVFKLVLPVPTLPAPRGRFPISRVTAHVRASKLPSASSSKPPATPRRGGAARSHTAANKGLEFNLHVYYPGRRSSGGHQRPAPYLTHGEHTVRGFAAVSGMSKYLLHHVMYVRHHVTKGGDMSQRCAKYPVILFSHGLGGTPDCYRVLIEELVSLGFVVVAPEHSDQSAAFTQLTDGTRTPYRKLTPAEQSDEEKSYALRHAQLQQRVRELQLAMEYVRLASTMSSTHHAAIGLRPLRGKLNLASMVVMGHSFGGATALAYAQTRKTSAVIALDPWMFPLSPSQRTRGLPDTPVLAISGRGFTVWGGNAYKVKHMLLPHDTSGVTAESDSVRAKRAADTVPYPPRASPNNVVLSLWDLEHQNFSDWCVLAPLWLLRRVGTVGPADPTVGIRTVFDFVRQFLVKHVVVAGAVGHKEQVARVKAMGFTKSHATTDTPLLDHSCWCRPTNLDSSHVLPPTCRVWGAPGVVSHASAKAHTAALRHRARARSSSSMSGSGDADLDAALAMASDAGAPSSPAAQRGGTPTNKTAAAVRRRVSGGAPSTPESAAS